MERKLLSLPSFFVLLLVAGIAFLATPVVDVHAQLGTDPTIARTTPATGTASSGNLVFTITFAAAVKVKGETTSGQSDAWDASEGFGTEDLDVRQTWTAPANLAGSDRGLTSNEYTLRKTNTNPVAGSGTIFTVTLAVPSNATGSVAVDFKAYASGSVEFEELTGGASYAAADIVAAVSIPFNTYDGLKPAVEIEVPDTASADPFLVTFNFTDTPASSLGGFGAAGPTFAKSSIQVTGGTVGELGTLREITPSTTPKSYTVQAYVTATQGETEVIIGVAADAVMDASGNGNAAIPHTKSGTPPVPNTSAGVVPVDSILPFVDISHVAIRPTQTAPVSKTNVVTRIDVTFSVKEGSATAAATETRVLQSDDGGNAIVAREVTVLGGTLGEITTREGTFAAIFDVAITPSATATEVMISVSEDAVMDTSGNGNAAATKTVSTGYVAPVGPGTPDVPDTGVGDELPGNRRGFSFPLPAMVAPTATDGSDRFVVLAKSNVPADNGLSVPGARFVDIDDRYWQDLRDFLAYDGGTIDLIGPAGTEAKDLVISEIMWGSDEGLSDPTRSQWIELYNTKTTKDTATGAISAGTWEIEFRAGQGSGTPSGGNILSDSFSNRELGNAHWDIPNQAGGKYGQSGRTKLTVGTAGTLRDLVSMRRKLDFAKVEKTDHKENAGENRTEQEKGIPNGALAGSWEASTSRVNMSGTRKGTPGARHVVIVGTTGISKSVVFNEIANRSDKKFDWIELYNPGSSDVKINNWVLSKVTGVDKDDKLFKFESDENIVVPAKGFLLVVNEDPSETALAAGENVNNPNSNANGLPTKVYINSGLDIPKEKFLLILRTEEKLKSHEKIVDIGGHLAGLTLTHTGSATELWPLKAWKRIQENDLLENNDKTWVRDKGKDLYHGDAWKSDGGVTGLGIDRNPDSSDGPTSGTPGFDNGAIKDKVKDLTASDPVVISEIMFGTGNGRLPQWIELFNPSKTQAVKLHNWRLEVENTIDASEKLNVEFSYTLTLPDVRIQPNQTILIVSSSIGDSTRDRFPRDRIINIWSTRTLRDITEMSSPRDAILSAVGFYIKLSDPDKVKVDEVGNIDGNSRTPDEPAWALPGGNLDDGARSSMIRRKATFGDGTEADAWISAHLTDGSRVGTDELYYGDEDDIGTPGYRAGGPLPVQLSSFYSKRNDAGAVIITWSTESELDNAGFNLLRSSSRSGEFTKINAQLIPGAGTTGEKNTYTWTDTGAHPNVVYYYQIEDVSLDGAHRTLRTTRLRGHVGAHGKLTTTWGVLKSRD